MLDVREHRLTRDGVVIPLPPRVFDVLIVLVEHAGSLVTKEQLLAEVWKDATVEEANLAVAVSAIRKAIGADAIETVPKHGYRFTALVDCPDSTDAEAQSEPVAPARGPRRRRSLTAVGASLVVVCTAAGAAVYLNRNRSRPETDATPVRPVGARLTTDPAEDAHPSWSPGGRVVFSSDRDAGDMEIYTADDRGSNLQRLTHSPGRDQDPAWSPDGALIAFASERGGDGPQIYVMNADGSHVRRVTALRDSCTMPAWSPDGRQLVFQRTDDPSIGQDIYTVRIDGTALTRLTRHRASDVSPDWSPDGKWIAFATNRGDDRSNFDIYVVSATGRSTERRLTDDPATDVQPAWSPDGTQIAFTSNRDRGPARIYLMNADGSGQRPFSLGTGTTPSWSPDGHEIVFASDREGNPEIFREPVERSEALTDHRAFDAFGTWSPDGRRVIFTSNRDGKRALYLMHVATRDVTRLTDGLANDWFPSWSPDGTEVVFQSDRDGTGLNLYVMNLASRAVRPLVRRQGMNASPAWAPNGRLIAFMSNAGGLPYHFQLTLVSPDGSNLHVPRPSTFFDADPAWSPDSSRIAFTSDRTGSFDVFAMAVAGTDLRQLTSSPASERNPSWSPDGELIAYASSRGRTDGDHDIYQMRADGTNTIRLTTRTGEWPRWHPSGDAIMFSSRRSHDENIFLFRKPFVRLNDAGARRD